MFRGARLAERNLTLDTQVFRLNLLILVLTNPTEFLLLRLCRSRGLDLVVLFHNIVQIRDEKAVWKAIHSFARNINVATADGASKLPFIHAVVSDVVMNAVRTERVQAWQSFRFFQAIQTYFTLKKLIANILR